MLSDTLIGDKIAMPNLKNSFAMITSSADKEDDTDELSRQKKGLPNTAQESELLDLGYPVALLSKASMTQDKLFVKTQ